MCTNTSQQAVAVQFNNTTIKFNQHFSKTASTKSEYSNIHERLNNVVLDCISFNKVNLIHLKLSTTRIPVRLLTPQKQMISYNVIVPPMVLLINPHNAP